MDNSVLDRSRPEFLYIGSAFEDATFGEWVNCIPVAFAMEYQRGNVAVRLPRSTLRCYHVTGRVVGDKIIGDIDMQYCMHAILH